MIDDLDKFLTGKPDTPPPKKPKDWRSGLDPDFGSRIDQLHDWAKQRGIGLKVREGYRSAQTQDNYYAQGRTRPGKIITYAKGGQSDHQYGQAIDVDPSDGNYRELGKKAKELGLKWGGDWKNFKDWGHVYLDDKRKGRAPATSELDSFLTGGAPSTDAPAQQAFDFGGQVNLPVPPQTPTIDPRTGLYATPEEVAQWNKVYPNAPQPPLQEPRLGQMFQQEAKGMLGLDDQPQAPTAQVAPPAPGPLKLSGGYEQDPDQTGAPKGQIKVAKDGKKFFAMPGQEKGSFTLRPESDETIYQKWLTSMSYTDSPESRAQYEEFGKQSTMPMMVPGQKQVKIQGKAVPQATRMLENWTELQRTPEQIKQGMSREPTDEELVKGTDNYIVNVGDFKGVKAKESAAKQAAIRGIASEYDLTEEQAAKIMNAAGWQSGAKEDSTSIQVEVPRADIAQYAGVGKVRFDYEKRREDPRLHMYQQQQEALAKAEQNTVPTNAPYKQSAVERSIYDVDQAGGVGADYPSVDAFIDSFRDLPFNERVARETARQDAYKLSPEEWKYATSRDLGEPGLAKAAKGSLIGASGRIMSSISGTAQLMSLTSPIFRAMGMDKMAADISRRGQQQQIAAEVEQKQNPGYANSVLRFGIGSTVDIARYALLARLPGGWRTALTIDPGMQAAGTGATTGKITQETTKGFITAMALTGLAPKVASFAENFALKALKNPVFDRLPVTNIPNARLKELVDRLNIPTEMLKQMETNPAYKARVMAGIAQGANEEWLLQRMLKPEVLANTPAEKLAAKVFGEAGRIGSIFTSVATIERISGKSPEQSVETALHMSLAMLAAQYGPKVLEMMKGRVISATSGKGETIFATVEPNGTIRRLKGEVPDGFVDMDFAFNKDTGKYEPSTRKRIGTKLDPAREGEVKFQETYDQTPEGRAVRETESRQQQAEALKKSQQADQDRLIGEIVKRRQADQQEDIDTGRRALPPAPPIVKVAEPTPEATAAVASSPFAQRLLTKLADRPSITLDEWQKLSGLGEKKFNEALTTLHNGGVIQINPDGSLSLNPERPPSTLYDVEMGTPPQAPVGDQPIVPPPDDEKKAQTGTQTQAEPSDEPLVDVTGWAPGQTNIEPQPPPPASGGMPTLTESKIRRDMFTHPQYNVGALAEQMGKTPQEIRKILPTLQKSTNADVAKKFGVTEAQVQALRPLGEIGYGGYLSHRVRATVLDPINEGLFNDLSDVFTNGELRFRDADFETKGAIADALMDSVAKSVGKPRASQMTEKDWTTVLQDNADVLTTDAVAKIVEATDEHKDWTKQFSGFSKDPRLHKLIDTIINDLGISTFQDFQELDRQAYADKHKITYDQTLGRAGTSTGGPTEKYRKAILQLGDEYAGTRKADGRPLFTRDAVKRAYDREILGRVGQPPQAGTAPRPSTPVPTGGPVTPSKTRKGKQKKVATPEVAVAEEAPEPETAPEMGQYKHDDIEIGILVDEIENTPEIAPKWRKLSLPQKKQVLSSIPFTAKTEEIDAAIEAADVGTLFARPLTEDDNKAFKGGLARYQANRSGANESAPIRLMNEATPLLEKLGLPDKPIDMAPSVLKKIEEYKHGIPMGILEMFAEGLNDPIAVFDSPQGNGNFYVLVDSHSRRFGPVAIVIKPTSYGPNVVTTAFMPQHDALQAPRKWMEELVGLAPIKSKGGFLETKRNLLRYWNSEKGNNLLASLRTFPQDGSQAIASTPRLLTEQDFVKEETPETTETAAAKGPRQIKVVKKQNIAPEHLIRPETDTGEIKSLFAREGTVEMPEKVLAHLKPYTITFLKKLENFQGRDVKIDTIRQNLKQGTVKQVERDMVEDILNRPQYKNATNIPYGELERAIRLMTMPVDTITTGTYADAGMGHVGMAVDNTIKRETRLLNSPIKHGITGHFSNDFSGRRDTNWVVQRGTNPETGEDIFMAVPEGITFTGTTEEEAAEYVGMTSTSHNAVADWIAQRNSFEEAAGKGMIGHYRVWTDGDITYVAEMQSDVYQQENATQLLITIYTNLLNAAKLRIGESVPPAMFTALRQRQKVQERQRQITNKHYNVLDYVGEIKNQSRRLQMMKQRTEPVVKALMKKWKAGEFDEEKLTQVNHWNAAEGIAKELMPQLRRQKLDVVAEQVRAFLNTVMTVDVSDDLWIDDKYVNPKTREERVEIWKAGKEQQIRTNQEQLQALQMRAQNDQAYNTYVAMGEDLKAIDKTISSQMTLTEKQFIAHQKNYMDRLMREAVRAEALKGQKTVLFPTAKTVAQIEWGMYPRPDAEHQDPMGGEYRVENGPRTGPLTPGHQISVPDRGYFYVTQSSPLKFEAVDADKVIYESHMDWVSRKVNEEYDKMTPQAEQYNGTWMSPEETEAVFQSLGLPGFYGGRYRDFFAGQYQNPRYDPGDPTSEQVVIRERDNALSSKPIAYRFDWNARYLKSTITDTIRRQMTPEEGDVGGVYRITRGDEDDLRQGDRIEKNGYTYTITETNDETITVTNADNVYFENYDDYARGEIDSAYEEVAYQARKKDGDWMPPAELKEFIRDELYIYNVDEDDFPNYFETEYRNPEYDPDAEDHDEQEETVFFDPGDEPDWDDPEIVGHKFDWGGRFETAVSNEISNRTYDQAEYLSNSDNEGFWPSEDRYGDPGYYVVSSGADLETLDQPWVIRERDDPTEKTDLSFEAFGQQMKAQHGDRTFKDRYNEGYYVVPDDAELEEFDQPQVVMERVAAEREKEKKLREASEANQPKAGRDTIEAVPRFEELDQLYQAILTKYIELEDSLFHNYADRGLYVVTKNGFQWIALDLIEADKGDITLFERALADYDKQNKWVEKYITQHAHLTDQIGKDAVWGRDAEQPNVATMNSQALRIVQEAFQAGAINASYSTPHAGVPDLLQGLLNLQAMATSKGHVALASGIEQGLTVLKSAIDSTDYGDLILYTKLPGAPDIERYGRQEELSHMASLRLMKYGLWPMDAYEANPDYKAALDILEQGPYAGTPRRTLLFEVIGKMFRDDAERELGLTKDELHRLIDFHYNQLRANGVTDEDIIKEYDKKISEAAERFVQDTKQRAKNASTELGGAVESRGPPDATDVRRPPEARDAGAEGSGTYASQALQTTGGGGGVPQAGAGGYGQSGQPTAGLPAGDAEGGTTALQVVDFSRQSSDPATLFSRPMSVVEESFPDPDTIPEEEFTPKANLTRIEKLLDDTLPNFLYDGERDVEVAEAVGNTLRTGYLAGWSVVSTNLTGNTLNAATEQGVKLFAGPLDWLNAHLSPKSQGMRNIAGISGFDIFKGLFGKEGGIATGIFSLGNKGLLGAFRHGVTDMDEIDRFDFTMNAQAMAARKGRWDERVVRNTGVPIFDIISEATKRLAVGIDRPAKAFAETAEYRGLTKRIKMRPEMARVLAKDYAKTVTFQSHNAATEAIAKIKAGLLTGRIASGVTSTEAQREVAKQIGQALYVGGTYIAPFTTTPTNIGIRALEYTPAGLGLGAYRYYKIGRTVERQTWAQKVVQSRKSNDFKLAELRKAEDSRYRKQKDAKRKELNQAIKDIESSTVFTDEYKAERVKRAKQNYKTWFDKWKEAKTKYEDERMPAILKERAGEDDLIRKARQAEDGFWNEYFTRKENRNFVEGLARTGFGQTFGNLFLLGVVYGIIKAVGWTDYDDEKDKWQAKREAGIPDNSVRINGYRFPYDNTPFGKQASIAVTALEQAKRPGTASQKAEGVIWGSVKGLGTLSPFTDTRYDEEASPTSMGKTVRSFTPIINLKILEEIQDVADSKPRTTYQQGFTAPFKQRIPGLRQTLPAQKHPLGQKGDLWWRFGRTVNPLKGVQEMRPQESLTNTPYKKVQ